MSARKPATLTEEHRRVLVVVADLNFQDGRRDAPATKAAIEARWMELGLSHCTPAMFAFYVAAVSAKIAAYRAAHPDESFD